MIALAVLKALKSRSLNKMGDKNYQLVKKDYSWPKVARETFEIYKKIIGVKLD